MARALALLFVALLVAPAAAWPMDGADAARTGAAAAQGSEGTGGILWRVHQDEDFVSFRTPPVVGDGRIFHASYRVETTDDGTRTGPSVVYARDLEGAELWRYEVDGDIRKSPTLVGGLVVVGTTSGTLHALGAADGVPAWMASFGGPLLAGAVAGDSLFVSYLEGGGGGVARLDAGVVRWQRELPGRPTEVAVHEGIVYGATLDGHLFALAAQTGAPLWTKEGLPGFASGPVVVPDKVIVGDIRGGLHAFDLLGEPLWSTPTGGLLAARPAVADGIVFAMPRATHLHAVDAEDGAVLWTAPREATEAFSPVVVGDRVFVATIWSEGRQHGASFQRTVERLDAYDKDGQHVFKHQDTTGPLAFADGMLILAAAREMRSYDLGRGLPSDVRKGAIVEVLPPSPATPPADRPFSLSVRVSNAGDVPTMINITLLVDGDPVGSRSAFLFINEVEVEAFTLQLPAGEHRVEAIVDVSQDRHGLVVFAVAPHKESPLPVAYMVVGLFIQLMRWRRRPSISLEEA